MSTERRAGGASDERSGAPERRRETASGDDPRWYVALPPRGPGPSEHWTSPAFEAELRAWLDESLAGLGTTLAALEVDRQRPWSTVWRVTASDGSAYWAKQNCPLQNFEARLLVLLDRLAGDRVVPVVAADEDRGLHLVPDLGRPFRETVAGDDIDAWCRVASEAMQLQRELAGHEDDLVAAGLVRMPAAEMWDYVAARTAALASLPADDPRRMEPDIARAVLAMEHDVRAWPEVLDPLGLPDSLVHNDLHSGNVFATPDGMRFFDFGDSVLAHPLAALFIPVNSLAAGLPAAPDDPRLERVVDAALEVWSDVAPAAELRRALPAALQVGRLARAESWLRVTATMTPDEVAEWGDAGPWWVGAIATPLPLA